MSKNLTTEEFIEKAKNVEKHKNKNYDYSKFKYINAITKSTITCPIHGGFEQTPNGHLSGRGCRKCAKKFMDVTEFINRSNEIFDFKYDYSSSDYINNHTKIKIFCFKHGFFEKAPSEHLYGSGCNRCAGFVTNKEEFIERSKEIHGCDKYNYDKVIYVNSTSEVEIWCNKCMTIFNQVPQSHISGCGCWDCGKETFKKTISNKQGKLFFKEAPYVHNNKYNYSNVKYTNSETKVDITCPIHGSFMQEPRAHLSGQGCKKCSSSKGEIKILKFLTKNNVKNIHQKTFDDCIGIKRKLLFDFYLPEYNICIEYDGKQHFMSYKHFGGEEAFEKLKTNDQIKTDYCKNNNINLLRIPYTEFKNIEGILQKELNIHILT